MWFAVKTRGQGLKLQGRLDSSPYCYRIAPICDAARFCERHAQGKNNFYNKYRTADGETLKEIAVNPVHLWSPALDVKGWTQSYHLFCLTTLRKSLFKACLKIRVVRYHALVGVWMWLANCNDGDRLQVPRLLE